MITISTSKINTEALRKKLEKRLSSKYQLEVGFFETAKYSTGEYVAQVAFWNEYGTVLSPPRPFFRNAIKENTKKWVELFKNTLFQTKDMYKTLGIVGTIIKDDIATSIIEMDEPPNSKITIEGLIVTDKEGKIIFEIKGKGFNNPLVHTGFMNKSVTYQITQKGN